MDLKTFIAESLTQIAEGIREAQKSDSGAIISPRIAYTDKDTPRLATGMFSHAPQMIEFDVAVTVTEADGEKGGGKIGVSFLNVGGEITTSSKNTSTSRIRFEIPVVWPEGRK